MSLMIQEGNGVERYKKMENKEMEKLVVGAINGDRDSFDEIVKLKTESIIFSSLSILRQYQDAQDAAQEVVLKMYKNIRKLKDPTAFNAWLQRIIINQCYYMQKSKARKKETMNMDGEFNEIHEEDREFLPQGYAENKEQSLFIRDIIKNLPEQKRMVVTMYYYEELSYKEIAYALDISINTVASDLKRSREIIKTEIEKVSPFDPAEVNRFAAIPVLSQILTEQAYEEIPRTAVKEMLAYTHTKTFAAEVAGKSAGVFSWKLVTSIVVCSVLVTTGIVFAISSSNTNGLAGNTVTTSPAISNENIVSQENQTVPQGDILFSESACECGHVNPKDITVSDIGDNYTNVTFTITNTDTGDEYVGSSVSAREKLNAIYEKKLGGNYKIEYVVSFESGDLVLDREFLVDTGTIKPGKYQ